MDSSEKVEKSKASLEVSPDSFLVKPTVTVLERQRSSLEPEED